MSGLRGGFLEDEAVDIDDVELFLRAELDVFDFFVGGGLERGRERDVFRVLRVDLLLQRQKLVIFTRNVRFMVKIEQKNGSQQQNQGCESDFHVEVGE